MLKKVFFSVFLAACVLVAHGYAQETEEIVFSGIPVVKISEAGVNRVVENLKDARALEGECTITKVSDKYYWKTRNNIELILIQGGAFQTFVATSGAGYIRVIPSNLKQAASLMDETEKHYDYVEHMLIGLRSVTYYGNSKSANS